MTISRSLIESVAPDVSGKAREVNSNEFISFSSLEAICGDDEILNDLLFDLALNSLRYAETVCRFEIVLRQGQASSEEVSMPDKVKILRYAQLVLKQAGTERFGLRLSEKETEEMKSILQELQMTGEEVLELAADAVTSHFERQ